MEKTSCPVDRKLILGGFEDDAMKVIILSLLVIMIGDYKDIGNGKLFYSALINGKKINWETHKISEEKGLTLTCNTCHKMHK